MLHGERINLRARRPDDVAVLHAELYEDVATRSRADNRPWRPVGPDASPVAIGEPSDSTAVFSVERRPDGELAGEGLLWGIDLHNRSAHLGVSLRPAYRGRGLGADVVRVLVRFGFDVRVLHRLQVETLVDNAAMIAAARAVGFTLEGTLRRASWVNGTFADEVVLGLLAEEWTAGRAASG